MDNSGPNENGAAPIELDAEHALREMLDGVAWSAEAAQCYIALGDIRGCTYAVRCLRAYDDAAVKVLKLIYDKRAALGGPR